MGAAFLCLAQLRENFPEVLFLIVEYFPQLQAVFLCFGADIRTSA
jgi:hypothetical protein